MKILGIAALFIYISISLSAQNTWIKTINSSDDELIIDNQNISGGYRLFSYMYGEIVTNPTYYSQYFDYSKKYYITDQQLNFLDSIEINKTNALLVSPLRYVKKQNDSILLMGSSLDTNTNIESFTLFWIDSDLAILKDTSYAYEDQINVMYGFTLNHSNSIVFFRSYPIDENPDLKGYIFWEFSFSGYEISHHVDTINSSIFIGLEDSNELESYIVTTQEEVIHFNYNFEFVNQYDVSIPYFEPNHTELLNDSVLLWLGDYTYQNPPPILDQDLSRATTNLQGEVISQHFFGVPDTLDRQPRISIIDNDYYLIGGTKNYTQFPESSWISLYKSDHSGEVIYERYYGGDAKYVLNRLEITEDGGFLISGSVWDFFNYPIYYQHDIIILKVDSNGLLTDINKELDQKTEDTHPYPNPGNEFVIFESSTPDLTLRLLDIKGNLIHQEEFDYNTLIETSHFKPGSYTYIISHGLRMITSGLWIKQE